MPKVEAKVVQEEKPVAQQPGTRLDEAIMKPGKYEVTEQHTFKVDVNLALRVGRWLVLNGPGKGVDTHDVVFRMWSFEEMIELKKLATSYDTQKRIHMIDNDLLNRLKVQRLLVSWTFDRDNPRLKVFHVNGVLTDESWVAFTRLQPNIVTNILDEMNKVYEYNG